ncbi:MAG: hypothetical protein ACXAC5_14610 [Promethearchaeota archaeon]
METVLGCILKACVLLGHRASWATVGAGEFNEPVTKREMEALGIVFIGDFSSDISWEPFGGWAGKFRNLRKAMWSKVMDDNPVFTRPEHTAAVIENTGADAIILHWDTWFEYLIPYFRKIPVFAYWARPRYASALTLLDEPSPLPDLRDSIRRWAQKKILEHQKKRHIDRAKKLKGVSNICAIDTMDYVNAGIPCRYIPNTWPDAFGPNCLDKRISAENGRSSFEILGALGMLPATGNFFGISFWANKVLPLLEMEFATENWRINICGKGFERLPESLRIKLDSPRVNCKGFVEDIDHEVLSNKVFLMCNNAGPYTGGYTRVIYAMSSGSCLIGHRRLTESMPEVRHGYNALLGETPEEIGKMVVTAYRDPEMRMRIGEAARQTYLKHYAPEQVFSQLADLMGSINGR